MREIKFRAWNTNTNSYLKKYDGIEEIGIFTFSVFNSILSNQAYRKEELELQQFIGLLDKNGKEIYEGDMFESQMDGYEENCVVEFHDGCFCLVNTECKRPINTSKSFLNWTPVGEENGYSAFEIIGNIYENPELL